MSIIDLADAAPAPAAALTQRGLPSVVLPYRSPTDRGADASRREFPTGRTEADRLEAVRALGEVGDQSRPELEALTRLATFVCGTAGALISVIDAEYLWAVAGQGPRTGAVVRSDAMCATSIQSHDVTYTPDAAADPMWAGNPFVCGDLARVRTYAAAPLIMPSGDIVGTVCVFDTEVRPLHHDQLERLRDIADQAALLLRMQGQISNLDRAATRDPLTGLPNMTLFEHSLDRVLASFERGGPAPTVLFLDLDRFKAVNDTHGHSAGDELLCTVTSRLLAVMRGTDVLARRSGDEFVVVLDDAGDQADQVAERLRAALTGPIAVRGATVEIGVSIGLATACPGDTAASLLHRADAAMYCDKRARH